MSQIQTDSVSDRRCQILDAALVCFAKHGFHQTSMHDISAEAGISVGLIYRYFENKEAVISAMADRHKKEISEVLQRAKQAPTLLESLEILFTAHCCEEETPVVSAFVVDLYSEASRNPRVADLVRDADLLPKVQQAAELMLNTNAATIAPLLRRWVGHGERFGRV